MNKICTSIEQSKKLIKLGLDVNTADMYWEERINLPKVVVGNYALHIQCRATDKDYKKLTNPVLSPAWSLAALLGLMPTFTLNGYGNGQFNCRDERVNNYALVDTCPLDAAFEMICWLLESKKL